MMEYKGCQAAITLAHWLNPISETHAFGCTGGHQAATRGHLAHQSDLLKPA